MDKYDYKDVISQEQRSRAMQDAIAEDAEALRLRVFALNLLILSFFFRLGNLWLSLDEKIEIQNIQIRGANRT